MKRRTCFLLAVGVVCSLQPVHADTPSDTDAPEDAAAEAPPEASPTPSPQAEAERKKIPVDIRAYWENDGINNPVGSQDRHRTNAMALTVAYQPDWSDRFFADIGLPAEDTAVGVGIGQQFYTATHITDPDPPADDEPYAGYLYGSIYFQRLAKFLDTDVDSLDHFQVDIGVVGESAGAETVQKQVHETFDELEPMGWDTQLPDEFAFQVYYRKKWRLADLPRIPLGDHEHLEWQVIPQGAVALGTVEVFAEIAAMTRIGYHLPDDFGPGNVRDYNAATGLVHNLEQHGLSAYGFGRITGRVVGWNTFLDGSLYHHSRSAESETWVGEAEVGVATAYNGDNWRFEFSWALTFTTDRYETQTTNDSWATIMLAFTSSF